MRSTTQLRHLLDECEIVVAPGAFDALSARIARQAGSQVIYVSGAGVSASLLGMPDLGLLSFDEMLGQIRRIVAAVDVPVVADADTGYGNAINVRRTVREYERAGAAGMHLEDQVFPKRCGHFEGKEVIPADDMVQKLRSAIDAREDPDFLVIARTDARAMHGLDEAIRRGKLYAEAGADMIFIEAPQSVDEMRTICSSFDTPLLANMVEGGKTPLLNASELESLGYKLVILPGTLQRAAAMTMQAAAIEIRNHGSSQSFLDRVLSFEGRNEITGLAEYHELERAFSSSREGADVGV